MSQQGQSSAGCRFRIGCEIVADAKYAEDTATEAGYDAPGSAAEGLIAAAAQEVAERMGDVVEGFNLRGVLPIIADRCWDCPRRLIKPND